MKRFTEALKWRDPWFRELSVDGKLVFYYFVDNCDAAGVWEPDYPMVNFCLKRDIEWGSVWSEFGDRVVKLSTGKLWMRKFIAFQYGHLTESCAPHRTVIALVIRHGLVIDKGNVTLSLDYKYPPNRVKDKEEEKDKEAEKDIGGAGGANGHPPRARNLLIDALAEIEGTPLAGITQSVAKRLAVALKEIRETSPEVTAEEIWRRSANYAQHFKAVLTAGALAKWWGKCDALPANAQQELIDDESLERRRAF